MWSGLDFRTREETTPCWCTPRTTGICCATLAATTRAAWWAPPPTPAATSSGTGRRRVLSYLPHEAYNQAMIVPHVHPAGPLRRLHVISSTQIVYHVRRVCRTLASRRIRVEKPAVAASARNRRSKRGVSAFVTMKGVRPCACSAQGIANHGSPRQKMEIKIRLGANSDGRIARAWMVTLSNSGAYGGRLPGHGRPDGACPSPLYTGLARGVPVRRQRGGHEHAAVGRVPGFGATQASSPWKPPSTSWRREAGTGAEQNMVREGMAMPPTSARSPTPAPWTVACSTAATCSAGRRSSPFVTHRQRQGRAAGIAMSCRVRASPASTWAPVTVKLNDDGGYMLLIAAADMGTGRDTILAQMVAEHGMPPWMP